MLVRKKGEERILDLQVNYRNLLGTWYDLYDSKFLEGDYMRNLMSFLYLAYDSPDVNIKPALSKDIFAAFREVDMDFCNAIVVTEFPTTTNYGSGIGLGNREFTFPYVMTPEFLQFRTMVEENLYDGRPQVNFDISLKEASQNGILFLNTALTCTSENNRAHVKHWEKFIRETLKCFEEVMSDKAFVFIGEAKKFANIPEKKYHEIFVEPNSIDFCVQNGEYWNTDIFTQVNNYLIGQFGKPYSETNPFI